MRLFNLSVLLGAATLAATVSAADSDDDSVRESTYFNSKKVPPMVELTPENWAKEAKESKWLLVKHYR